jgi:hypothetical protein
MPSHHPTVRAHESCSFILAKVILSRHTLDLAPDKVRDLLVLRLLDGALVILRSLSQETLLDEVDA